MKSATEADTSTKPTTLAEIAAESTADIIARTPAEKAAMQAALTATNQNNTLIRVTVTDKNQLTETIRILYGYLLRIDELDTEKEVVSIDNTLTLELKNGSGIEIAFDPP